MLHNPFWGDPIDGYIFPDATAAPGLYEGVLLRRCAAYLVDVVLLFVLGVIAYSVLWVIGLLTLGLLWVALPLVGLLLPPLYHGLTIGGPASATPGMRVMGLQVRSILDNQPPTLWQGLAMGALFYITIALTAWLILLVVLFNPRSRTLHDWLAGTVVVRHPPALL